MKELVFRAGGVSVLLCTLVTPGAAEECRHTSGDRGRVVPSACAIQPRQSANGASAGTPANPAPAPGYVIGPDDVLTVAFWRDQISADVVVRPDGRISLPLLNDVQAAGYTPEGLARALEEVASKYITEPSAVVMVKEIHSRKVFVLGEVATPGVVPLIANMNLLQLIAMSGGLLEHADKKNIIVIRTENGQEKRLTFNYNDVVKGKNVKQNIQLQPGDTIVVR